MNASSRSWAVWLALALGVFVYLFNLGSEHAATNPDEHLYWQITRMTAQGGEWLPLKNLSEPERNTKPPALFWQGIIATDWGKHWDLWRVRLPVALYTLATTALVLLLARRLSGDTRTGILAALAFLAFFSTYRYGRVVLTSSPETFWFFLPFFILLYRRPQPAALTWPLAAAFGLMVGAGLLYKSFALVIPFAVGLAWWTMHQRSYDIPSWLRAAAPKIILIALLAVGVFGLWFWLDPHPENIWRDFVLKENVGKFDPKRGSYIVNFFAGNYTIWRILFGYPFNAGLLAPAVVVLFFMAWRGRRSLSQPEQLLWIWILTQMIVFAFPNQRDERYLLPAMPALAVLLAISWSKLPRWTFTLSLSAVALIACVFPVGAAVLTGELQSGQIYPWWSWVVFAAVIAFTVAGLRRDTLARAFICPAILLLYLAYAVFLIPFDGPLGAFDEAAKAAVRGKKVVLPSVYGAHDEVYRFILPGCDLERVHIEPPVKLDDMRGSYPLFILPVPARDHSIENAAGLRVLGARLNLVDRFKGNETQDMLRGNITGQLFKKDLLIEVTTPADTSSP
ncbi:MAG: phospholipid carrier-dependent glycosyltransferase [Chthoniobacterales bacterium]|nr:phospholipid carrier-dependent glycosyltransferase [Chthoniobacterales bacterium]